MGVMELVAFVQAEWGVTVELQELVVENFDSVRKVARLFAENFPSQSRRVHRWGPRSCPESAPLIAKRES